MGINDFSAPPYQNGGMSTSSLPDNAEIQIMRSDLHLAQPGKFLPPLYRKLIKLLLGPMREALQSSIRLLVAQAGKLI